MVHHEPGTSSRQTFDCLLAVSILMAEDMAKGLADRGLTRARANALWEIARHGPTTQRQLADLLHVTPRNITKLIDALEQGGFVVRTGHDSDRRAVLVRLTPQGATAAERLESEANALADELFGDLSAADRRTVARALDGAAARLRDLTTTPDA
ncbi:MarR family winged helix-turn-helix transcriptional regulator [Plantactinospora sp. GCM10030261]|uniref:MarR family winged helix-turn-helix transcriptional regulator n=1 Tax=Plantactinospora sp. GCM10030261 TaxID=3273420 RepID=UPI00361E6C0C